MKKLYLIILLQLIAYAGFSQVQTNIIRQKTYGGNQKDLFSKAVKTSDGGYLIGVSSESGISGDRTQIRKGLSDIWLLKLNNDLTVAWQKSFGGSGRDFCSDIVITSDDGFLILTDSNSPVSLDKTAENYGINDYWLVKLDANGNIEWQKTYGGTSYNVAVQIIKYNNYYILSGISDSDSSGVKIENSRGGNDFWILLIDSIGSIIYDKTLGGNYIEFLNDAIINQQENLLLLTGYTSSDISGDITKPAYGAIDYLLFKCNPDNGQLISDFRYGGSTANVATTISKNNDKIYLGGWSNSDSSGVKTENSRSNGQWSDYWILKLKNDGSIVWDKTIGGNYYDVLYSMEFTNDHQLLLIGSSASDAVWEKTEPRIGQSDFWIVSLDTNANILWQKTIGGTLQDEPKQSLFSVPIITSSLVIQNPAYQAIKPNITAEKKISGLWKSQPISVLKIFRHTVYTYGQILPRIRFSLNFLDNL
jgi:hypothetical protein